MINLSRWKIGVVIAAILLGVFFSLPNFLPADVRDQMKGWAPNRTLNLGLDLQGGSYLLMEVDINDLKKTKLANILQGAEERLADEGIEVAGQTTDASSVEMRVTDPTKVKDAQKALAKLASPLPNNPNATDLNITTTDQSVRMTLTEDGIRSSSVQAVANSIEIIRKRIDPQGVKEPSILKQGTNRIVIEAPGESDPEQLKRLIGQTARLTFQMVNEDVTPSEIAANRIPPGSEMLYDESRGGYPTVVYKAIVVSGMNLQKATVGTDSYNRPAIDFTFNNEGAQKFGKATRENIGKRFAIILDGRIVSAPTIQGAITGGHGQITGSFTPQEASELVSILNGGALPAKLNFESQRTVGAELGKDAIDKGIISTVIGFVVIVIFMFLAYGFVFGGVSIAALLVNLLLILAAMTLCHATLTLPGIAGLILSLAVAVDANVLIFERIRDEARTGHKPIAAMDVGFSRALVSIMDANITSLIAALIMLGMGAGPVKGFAWTLLIGVFTSVFTAILVSQVLLGWWYRAARPKTLPI